MRKQRLKILVAQSKKCDNYTSRRENRKTKIRELAQEKYVKGKTTKDNFWGITKGSERGKAAVGGHMQ